VRRLVRCLIAATFIVVGCSAPAGSPAPPTRSPAVASPAPTTSSPEESIPPASVSPSVAVAGLAPNTVAEVVTDDLRVRTAPGTDDSSVVLEPLLQPGEMLFVVDGPVQASGYPWYQVLVFDEGGLTLPGEALDEEVFEHGWVAGADANGEAWLEAARPSCPAPPEDVAGVESLDGVTALACFNDQPITITAQVLGCDETPEVDPDGSGVCGGEVGSASYEPSWFDRTLRFLVPEHGSIEDAFLELHADPAGAYPEPLPFGEPVRVTGRFNHPAAAACAKTHYQQHDVPTVDCRTMFAVTAIESIEP